MMRHYAVALVSYVLATSLCGIVPSIDFVLVIDNLPT